MNSEFDDLELDALLRDLEKDANEIDQLCLEMDQLDLELEKLDKLIDTFNCLKSDKVKLNQSTGEEYTTVKLDSLVRDLKAALDKISGHFNNFNFDKRQFFTVIKKVGTRLTKVKTIQIYQIYKYLFLNFKYLDEFFQKIKHKNHIVMLQPRLQSINSIEA